jgi:hypothetical protein
MDIRETSLIENYLRLFYYVCKAQLNEDGELCPHDGKSAYQVLAKNIEDDEKMKAFSK